MQICMMDYGNLSADGKTAYLKCYGIGTFEVLSGIERYIINNPDCADHEKTAIPPGTYWVADRPAGSLYNRVRAEAIDAWHGYRNHHSEWSALFSDKTKKDSLSVNGLNRTGFRLHPLNSDGTGVSWGCITPRRYSDFQHLRHLLLKRGTFPVLGDGEEGMDNLAMTVILIKALLSGVGAYLLLTLLHWLRNRLNK